MFSLHGDLIFFKLNIVSRNISLSSRGSSPFFEVCDTKSVICKISFYEMETDVNELTKKGKKMEEPFRKKEAFLSMMFVGKWC